MYTFTVHKYTDNLPNVGYLATKDLVGVEILLPLQVCTAETGKHLLVTLTYFVLLCHQQG